MLTYVVVVISRNRQLFFASTLLFSCQLRAGHSDVDGSEPTADDIIDVVESEDDGNRDQTEEVVDAPLPECTGAANVETNRYCVMLFPAEVTRTVAEGHCQSLGTTLWDFDSEDWNVMINAMIIKSKGVSQGLIWTGGVASDNDWVWQNGESVQSELWESEANEVENGCLSLQTQNGFAHGRDCDEAHPYFCGFWKE